jgi:hypothetical protein
MRNAHLTGIVATLALGLGGMALANDDTAATEPAMQRFVIERDIPGAGRMTADLIREHAAKSGFPANRITPVSAVIDPTTANESP